MKMTIVPALCAALLLAACSGTDTSSETAPQMAGITDGTGPAAPDAALPGGVTNEMIPGSRQEFETAIGNTVRFETDSYSLTADAQQILQKQAGWLQQYPQHMVTIEGHADERGTREYNLALGNRRATTVLNYLTALGVDASRLSEVSYGKERPVCVDASDTCWNENRRSVTALTN
jgi:peptidoglycan-associated lipoprotein